MGRLLRVQRYREAAPAATPPLWRRGDNPPSPHNASVTQGQRAVTLLPNENPEAGSDEQHSGRPGPHPRGPSDVVGPASSCAKVTMPPTPKPTRRTRGPTPLRARHPLDAPTPVPGDVR